MVSEEIKDEKMADASESVTKKPTSKKDPKPEDDLSDEDLELKNNLDLMVTRIGESDPAVGALALTTIRAAIMDATASMTSVPKPLKFLRPHIPTLQTTFSTLPDDHQNRDALANVLSMLATTGPSEAREALKYRLLGSNDDATAWGHEYVRHLAGELAAEFTDRQANKTDTSDLIELVSRFVPYHMTHNAEPEAVDLLLEVEALPMLEPHVDAGNYGRTCLYLVACATYLPEPDNTAVLRMAHTLYTAQGRVHDAMRVALHLNERATIESTFCAATTPGDQTQLCYLLARHGVTLDLEEGPCAVGDDALREELVAVLSNSRLNEHFLALARDLDVMEPKVPDDVYKQHLMEGRAGSSLASMDSARANLAATFVNAFVNAGFGVDKLVTPSAEESTTHWIYKNRDHGQMSATASLGMVTMWDVEGGLPQIDKYMYSAQPQVVAGSMLAVGVVNCCVQNECDPAFALLYENVHKEDTHIRVGAIMGMGLAYAGTCKADVLELLAPIVSDPETSMEVAGFAAMSLGLVFTSTTNEECVSTMLQALMTRSDIHLSEHHAKLLCLGLALLFLGKQEVVEATVEVVKTVSERISLYCQVLLEVLAYAGTGDVLKVQKMMSIAGDTVSGGSEPWRSAHQAPAVLGIGLLAMGEDLGASMAQRNLEHLLQYCDLPVRRTVPLALALLNVSQPNMGVMDQLSRLSHDVDAEVAMSAVLALGIVGGGSNNARLAGLLRQLSSYYNKEPALLFLVRVAQGLSHMGKGLMTLQPYHTDHELLSGVGLAGLLGVLTAAFDMKATLVKEHHFMLYYLAAAMKPRMLMTVDEQGKQLPVPVRVGLAVDTVAQAGKPKTISGFQTHTTPVLLNMGDRAELATDKYIAATPAMEGVIVLRENPDYVEMDTN